VKGKNIGGWKFSHDNSYMLWFGGKQINVVFLFARDHFIIVGIIELGLSHLKDWDGRSRDISFQTLFQPERAFVCLA